MGKKNKTERLHQGKLRQEFEKEKTILAISLFVQCVCVIPLAMRRAERLMCSGMCVGSSEPTIKWCGAALPSPSTRTPTEIIAR